METFKAEEVYIGFHADGYRIDKTASPMNRYTQWEIDADEEWKHPKPVCFHALPEDGWLKVEKFEWDTME